MTDRRFSNHPPRPIDVGEADRWTRRFAFLVLLLLLVRVAYAAVFPLDLAPDESYYWDWGRRLDLGYYSKPPMIGWLMGLAGFLGHDSLFVLKVFPAVLATGGLVFVFLLGRDLFGARAGFWSALLLAATPGNAALATFFTIDPPLFFFWSGALWLAWRWWRAAEGRARWALLLTGCLGCGYLTKQICLVFPVALLVFAGVTRKGETGEAGGAGRWRELVGVIVGSLLFLIPPLIWNWRHDWITFRHTAEELEHRPFVWARSARFLGEFLGGQAALGGGLTWLLLMASLGLTLANWRRADSRLRFLALFSFPGLAAFLGLSVFQRVEQNWPLVFYPALAVLVGGMGLGEGLPGRRWRRGWFPVAAGLGGLLAVALMAVPFVVPRSSLAGARSDPTARVRGWRALAESVEAYRGRLPEGSRTFLLAPDDRYVASALAYYLPDRPRVYCWEDPAHPESQYGIWGRPGEEFRGGDSLVVVRVASGPQLEGVAARFATWTPLGAVKVGLGPQGDRDRQYQVFLGQNYRPEGAGTEVAP